MVQLRLVGRRWAMTIRMIDGGWYRARLGNDWVIAASFSEAVARCIMMALATSLVHCAGGE